jgi:hypothetical protein
MRAARWSGCWKTTGAGCALSQALSPKTQAFIDSFKANPPQVHFIGEQVVLTWHFVEQPIFNTWEIHRMYNARATQKWIEEAERDKLKRAKSAN